MLPNKVWVNLSYFLLHSPFLFPPIEEAEENDESSEVVPDYSQLRVPSAKTLPTLEDVSTKLFVGTEVHMPSSNNNVFNDERKLMSFFYQSLIQSVLAISFVAWYGNINVEDKNPMSHIVKVAGKVTDTPQTLVSALF